MISVQMDETNGIALLEPNGALSAEDFDSATTIIDAWIKQNDGLNGLIIHTHSFPGWDSFAALVSHLKFVKDHQNQIRRVAVATDSAIAGFAENIAQHFVNAELKTFRYDDLDQARLWVTTPGNT
jgi:hypothetical protein